MTAMGDVGDASGARPEWARRDERGSARMLGLMTWVSSSARPSRRAMRTATHRHLLPASY